MSIKTVFVRFVCPPGLKNDSQNWPTHTSVHQFSGFSLFQPKCDFEQPSNDLVCFYGFRVSLFGVGAVQNPIKHIPVAEAVPGHIFNMFLQKILPKMTPKRREFFTRDTTCWKVFEALHSFYTLFAKATSKTSKRTSEWHFFWTFCVKVAPKHSKKTITWTPKASRMTYGSTYFSKHGGGIMRSTGYIYIYIYIYILFFLAFAFR